MGFFSGAFEPSQAAVDFANAIEHFRYKSGSAEIRFRDALLHHLAEELAISPKGEGGLPFQGTRLDLCFRYLDEDFIVSIKQGLNEQKVKNVLGESVVVASTLADNQHQRRVNLVILVMQDERWDSARVHGDAKALHTGLQFLAESIKGFPRLSILVYLAICNPDGADVLCISA